MPEHRTTLDHVIPRIYVALPKAGAADVTLSQPDSPVERHLLSDILIFYAFDMDTHFQLVANRDLERLGIDEPALHERAVENLYKLNVEVRAHNCGRVLMLAAGGNYEATLILLPEIWESIAPMVQGSIIVSIPARDILLVTGDASPENLAELRRMTSRAIEQAEKPLSRAFLRKTDTGWVEYKGFAE